MRQAARWDDDALAHCVRTRGDNACGQPRRAPAAAAAGAGRCCAACSAQPRRRMARARRPARHARLAGDGSRRRSDAACAAGRRQRMVDRCVEPNAVRARSGVDCARVRRPRRPPAMNRRGARCMSNPGRATPARASEPAVARRDAGRDRPGPAHRPGRRDRGLCGCPLASRATRPRSAWCMRCTAAQPATAAERLASTTGLVFVTLRPRSLLRQVRGSVPAFLEPVPRRHRPVGRAARAGRHGRPARVAAPDAPLARAQA